MKVNPYAHIALERQVLRTSFSLIVFGKALLGLEKLTDVHCNLRDLANVDKLVNWHSAACDDLKKFPQIPEKAHNFRISMSKYENLAKNNQGRMPRVAMYIATSLLLLDAKITCPAVAKGKSWRFLLMAEDKVTRFLINKFPASDEAGTEIYLKLAWEAERKE